jgi:uridine monophosphate synthetase
MGFFERLEARARTADSLLCVGLDPHVEFLKDDTAEAAQAWCLAMIEGTLEAACAYKPNASFFETWGAAGWTALRNVIAAARRHAPVVLDAKRGDIASSAAAYARAVFDELGADAVTVSPYLGGDSLAPFLARDDKAAFVVCKSSNAGSDDLQGLRLASGDPLYLEVARQASIWNVRGNVGLVVGATDPDALLEVRDIAPDVWILAPGVGQQGGDVEAAVRAGLRSDGLGLLVPVSRSLAQAADPGAEARRVRDTLRRLRTSAPASPAGGLPRGLAPLAERLIEADCVRFGDFRLKSGLRSPIYIDLRRLGSFPDLLGLAARAYAQVIAGLTFDRLAAIPYAALPIGAALCLRTSRPLIYPRLDIKDYGTRSAVEGEYRFGETALLVDDLATTGGSKFEAIERLRAVGLLVHDVAVLIDRQSGAAAALAEAGVRLHAVFTLRALLDHWEERGMIAPEHLDRTRTFLAQSDA